VVFRLVSDSEDFRGGFADYGLELFGGFIWSAPYTRDKISCTVNYH